MGRCIAPTVKVGILSNENRLFELSVRKLPYLKNASGMRFKIIPAVRTFFAVDPLFLDAFIPRPISQFIKMEKSMSNT